MREVSRREGLAEDVLTQPGWVDDDVVGQSTLFKVDNL